MAKGKGGGGGSGSVDFSVDVNDLVGSIFEGHRDRNDLLVIVENGTSMTAHVYWSCHYGRGNYSGYEGQPKLDPVDSKSGTTVHATNVEIGFEAAGAGCNATIVINMVDDDGTVINYGIMAATPSNKSNYNKAKKLSKKLVPPFDYESIHDTLDDEDKWYANQGLRYLKLDERHIITINATGTSPSECYILIEDK